MAIKKISKGLLFSVVTLSGFVAALFSRLLFGGSDLNLAKMEEDAKKVLYDKTVGIPEANADIPSGCDVGGCSVGDGGGSGSGGSDGGDGDY